MKESVLKKEISSTDLQRMRNLIQGKTGDSTKVISGYNKKVLQREEGDLWMEGEQQWTIKNGIKQNISKLQKAREFKHTPLFCPKCSKLMKNKHDKDYYSIHRHCLNCQIDFEQQLKKEGTYEDYKKEIHNKEINGIIHNYEIWVDDLINESNDSYMSESGEVENWSKTNTSQIIEEKDKAINYLQKLKK